MIYRTHGTPSALDPLGALGEGAPADLEVRATLANGDGTWNIVVESFGTDTHLEHVPEGSGPGTVRERSGLRRADTRGFGARLRAIRATAPPSVQLVIDAAQAKRRGEVDRALMGTLLDVVENQQRNALERSLAALLAVWAIEQDGGD